MGHSQGPQPRSLNQVLRTSNGTYASGKVLRILVTIYGRTAIVILNSGAEGNFISHTFATKSNISLIRKNRPYPLRTVDGSASSYDKGWIRVETEPAKLTIGKHVEKITLDVTSILGHDIILGIPWFKAHEPHIKWKERTVTFPNKECAKHLATARRTPTDKSSQS